jgi:4-nitrophenyl phosphatase
LISSPTAVARLRAAGGFVFDMDGTLVLSDVGHKSARPLPGAADTINGLARMGLPFSVLTNGTLKPPTELAAAKRLIGVPIDRMVVVGDDPSLEIAMARRAGAFSVLVATGIAGREGLHALPEAQRPDLMVENVGEMWRLYRSTDATSTSSIQGAEL